MKRLKFLQKLRWKIHKCKKRKICLLFRGPSCNFFYKTAFISPNNPIGQQNFSLLIVFNVLIHEISRNLPKVAKKGETVIHFEVLVNFGRKLCVFFSVENLVYFFTKASLTTNLILVGRLYFSKLSSFSKNTQKLHNIFKNLSF